MHRLGAEAVALLELTPGRLRHPVDARDPGGGAGVDAAVERLVALTQLLPFEPRKAAADASTASRTEARAA